MIGSSKINRETYPRKCFWAHEKARVKFNPGLSANRPSNNWALVYNNMHNSVLVTWFLSCIIFFTMCFLAVLALALALVPSSYSSQFNTLNELTCYMKASRFKFFFTWDNEPLFARTHEKKKSCIFRVSLLQQGRLKGRHHTNGPLVNGSHIHCDKYFAQNLVN